MTAALSAFFAAVAALAVLGAIWQARALHREDAADRLRDRNERRKEFDREAAERQRIYEVELHLRQLEQLGRISDLVAAVRQTGRDEADPTDQGRIGQKVDAPFFWNARKQLELGLNILEALGGPDLQAGVGGPQRCSRENGLLDRLRCSSPVAVRVARMLD